jgi:DNA-binding MarR family transcriptional regulator
VSLNTSPGPPVEAPGSSRRDRLVEALLAELLSWNPREFIVAFRRWHHDAFSLIHLNVMTILEMDGPASMSQLADALDVSVASMTGIVDRMEKRGLVERRRDVDDRRVVTVHPTEAGRDIFRDIDRRRREGLVKMLSQLGEKELAGLLTGHRALRQARAAVMAEATAAHEPATASTGTVTPSALHRASTIQTEDRPVKTAPPRQP